MSGLHQTLPALITSLSAEVKEIIFFYVGDVCLYADSFDRPGSFFEALVIGQGGPGFVLEEAIRKCHKRLIWWLLTAVAYPIDYLLASTACYGDLSVLVYIVTLIGEEYKEYDTPAKLLCIIEGKSHMLDYLHQKNPRFKEGEPYTSCLQTSLIAGISNSSKMYSWYMRNQFIFPPIDQRYLIRGCLQNDDIAGAIEHIDNSGLAGLQKALAYVSSGAEETYRWLVLRYAGEADVLMYIARACARMGYVDTLENLLKQPYNVHVEYDFFAAIPDLAVVKVLHKYAYRRNSISCLLHAGCIAKVKSRFTTYRTLRCYRELLSTFTSNESLLQVTSPFCKKRHSEDVLLYLVDLAQVTSDPRLLMKYTRYSIECGHLRLLKKLKPFIQARSWQSLSQQIEAGSPHIYRSGSVEVVDYLYKSGATQAIRLDSLITRFDLRSIENFMEKGVVRNPEDESLVEWSLETKRGLTKQIWRSNSCLVGLEYMDRKDRIMKLVESTSDVFCYREHYCRLKAGNTTPILSNTSIRFTSMLANRCPRSSSNPLYDEFLNHMKCNLWETNMLLFIPCVMER
ncbi:hypothetical protein K493DRAFT_341637 [Basidiobolus meristosporus CBS 931.73]|uniref:Uncharacterized protein n=1 Tax=Basidiobolus meristosporus CBS 931.73 TaxID=1314790 RepID=A0A1Y1XLA0_9FUNG|nr:hypothetical protein K493DRAFT_341637 [Basidiobolus meristosporus CBS 931.73]|eukprot:ORX86492.1 hypothetical protein K493DRAFT_341637 [Basidiobolus meristosporus CBS 931.73]